MFYVNSSLSQYDSNHSNWRSYFLLLLLTQSILLIVSTITQVVIAIVVDFSSYVDIFSLSSLSFKTYASYKSYFPLSILHSYVNLLFVLVNCTISIIKATISFIPSTGWKIISLNLSEYPTELQFYGSFNILTEVLNMLCFSYSYFDISFHFIMSLDHFNSILAEYFNTFDPSQVFFLSEYVAINILASPFI